MVFFGFSFVTYNSFQTKHSIELQLLAFPYSMHAHEMSPFCANNVFVLPL
jgi:hypothetical protein